MKIKELFKHASISQSIGGTALFLDSDNCKITGVTKGVDHLILHLKRESDREEGRARLRVREEFKSLESQLLKWTFTRKSILGLSLNDLDEIETNLSVESFGGKLQLKS